MTLFSQRKGITPLKKEFQRESMDIELRNRLWSVLKITVWDKYSEQEYNREIVHGILDAIWFNYFKIPLDTRPKYYDAYSQEQTAYGKCRRYFFDAKWYEVYDFIEFLIKTIPSPWANELRDFCNAILEKENAAYRILEDKVTEITDETEIAAIEDALEINIEPVANHLKRSLELMSDRKEPDFRNSIKESISAVEACCQNIVGNPKATLGDALKKIKASAIIHPALEKGFSAIYGYTSDSGGIRHALTDGDEIPSYADAKFMLVACSSFINYLLTKTAEASSRK
jgi:hypothetical protein